MAQLVTHQKFDVGFECFSLQVYLKPSAVCLSLSVSCSAAVHTLEIRRCALLHVAICQPSYSDVTFKRAASPVICNSLCLFNLCLC
jgi:hypothetical protein